MGREGNVCDVVSERKVQFNPIPQRNNVERSRLFLTVYDVNQIRRSNSIKHRNLHFQMWGCHGNPCPELLQPGVDSCCLLVGRTDDKHVTFELSGDSLHQPNTMVIKLVHIVHEDADCFDSSIQRLACGHEAHDKLAEDSNA